MRTTAQGGLEGIKFNPPVRKRCEGVPGPSPSPPTRTHPHMGEAQSLGHSDVAVQSWFEGQAPCWRTECDLWGHRALPSASTHCQVWSHTLKYFLNPDGGPSQEGKSGPLSGGTVETHAPVPTGLERAPEWFHLKCSARGLSCRQGGGPGKPNN